MRWVVPPTHGAAMPAGLMVRNRRENGFIDESMILTLSRKGLAQTGLAVAKVTARAVEPLPGQFTGIMVRLDGTPDGDRTPEDDPAENPLSPGVPNYNFYSLEVVQRIGYDSFTPDNGVLIAKNKDSLRGWNGGPNAFNSFIWVIDAHPEDINMADYKKPNGEKVMRTIADYRQLNDALFHAGLDSGSSCEWEDTPNGLHFYVIDLEKNEQGILSYTLAVRSLEGSGEQERGAKLESPGEVEYKGDFMPVTFTLKNTGTPADAAVYLNSDVYRLSVSIEGTGWTAKLLNGLAAVEAGNSKTVTVYISAEEGSSDTATVTLKALSESDPTKTINSTLLIRGRARASSL
jgi:hypothetical protein